MNAWLPQALCVMAGSAVGGVARWAVGLWLNGLAAPFPLGTLAVNVAGGLAIGAAGAWLSQRPNEMLWLLLVTGVLGGFTTFSSFSYESLGLLQRGAWGAAAAHTLAHVAASLAGAALGWAAVQGLLAGR